MISVYHYLYFIIELRQSLLQMIPSADPSNPQYSMIPQLTTQMSTLHLGTGSVSLFSIF